MVNDISLEGPERNLLTKLADDLTVSAPVKISEDSAIEEVKNIKVWVSENRITLNMSKTWGMVEARGRTNKLPPPEIDNIERKSCLNLLGMLLQDYPCNWDMQVDNLLSKAVSRMNILRVCRVYGYTKENLRGDFLESRVFFAKTAQNIATRPSRKNALSPSFALKVLQKYLRRKTEFYWIFGYVMRQNIAKYKRRITW